MWEIFRKVEKFSDFFLALLIRFYVVDFLGWFLGIWKNLYGENVTRVGIFRKLALHGKPCQKNWPFISSLQYSFMYDPLLLTTIHKRFFIAIKKSQISK